MRKFTSISAALLFAGFGISAVAADMAPGRVAEGPQNGTYQVVVMGNGITLQWEDNVLHFTGNPSFEVSYNGGAAQTATTCQIGTQYDESETSYVYFNIYDYLGAEFDMETFSYTYNYGEYKVVIPAGIIANADGDVNPEQTISFTLCKKLPTDVGDGLILQPAESLADWDFNGNEVPAPIYGSNQLSAITLSWDDVDVEAANVEGVNAVAYIAVETQGAAPNYININSYISFESGKMVIDLSNNEVFTDDKWIVEIPVGYVIGTIDGSLYTNGQISLTYIIQNSAPALDDYQVMTPADPDSYYQNFLNMVSISFDGNEIEMAENAPAITFTYKGETHDAEAMVRYSSWSGYSLEASFGNDWDGSLPGLYKINIPAGVVTNGTNFNSEINLEWYVVESTNDYSVSPEPGYSSWSESYYPVIPVADFKEVTITFDGFTSVELNSYGFDPVSVEYAPSLADFNNYEQEMTELTADNFRTEGNKVIMTLPQVEEAYYVINIPTRNFIIDNDYTNQAIWLYYHVWNGMGEAKVLEGPKEYSSPYVTFLLTWDYAEINATDLLGATLLCDYGYTEIDVPASAFTLMNVPEDENGNHNPDIQADGYNALLISLTESIAEYYSMTEYPMPAISLRIPGGIVSNAEGQLNPEQTFSFEVYNIWAGQPECTETSDPGVYQLTWPANEMYATGSGGLFLVNDATSERYDLVAGNGFAEGGIGSGEYGIRLGDNWNDEFVFNVHGMGLEPGNYTLVVEEATIIFMDSSWEMYLNGEAYISLELDEISTAVENIDVVNDGIYSVYNLQGVKVLETTDASAIKSLNRGIYIINGKKVAVK